jgi:hypothetical protein
LIFGRVESTPDGLKIGVTAHCSSTAKAAETVGVAKAGIAAFMTALTEVPQILESSMLPVEYQTLDVAGRLVQTISSLKLDVKETQVRAEANFDADFVAKFAAASKALLARQTEEYQARAKADEQAHLVKLARLAEAFGAYHAEHGHYPPAAAVGPDGKTLHSWRVELLPYLGEQKLFEAYQLDEAWDGEHNKQLINRIPQVYSTTLESAKGDTDYFVVTGQGTLFAGDALPQRESISDAPGETILVLQGHQNTPWTKPEDIANLRAVRGQNNGFCAAFADGTVRLVPKTTDPATVRAMFTKAGRDEAKLR